METDNNIQENKSSDEIYTHSPPVYTFKHLFSVSPALRVKHFWELLAIRIFFALFVAQLIFSSYLFITTPDGTSKGISMLIFIAIAVALYSAFKLWLGPLLLVLVMYIFESYMMIIEYGFKSIAAPRWLSLLIILAAAISVWLINKTVEKDKHPTQN